MGGGGLVSEFKWGIAEKNNNKVTSNKTKHIENEKKLNDLWNKVSELPEKWYNFLLDKTYFTDNDGYQNFSVFEPMINSLTLHNNNKVTNWISTGISPKKIKQLDPSLPPIMSNLTKMVEYTWFILVLNNWPLNQSNNFELKNCLFGTAKLTENVIKSRIFYKGQARNTIRWSRFMKF